VPAIKVVNENTRETLQRQEFDDQADAEEWIEAVIEKLRDQQFMGGWLDGTELDAMMMRGASKGDVEAVHIYEERD